MAILEKIRDTMASRKKLVADLAAATLDHDDTGERLGQQIHALKEQSAKLQVELNTWEKVRGIEAVAMGKRASEIKARLLATADPAIDQATADMQTRLEQAERSRNNGYSHHSQSIEVWQQAAKQALQQLAALKLTALQGEVLQKEIDRINSAVPASW